MKLSDYIKMFDIDVNEIVATPDINEMRIVQAVESGILESLDDDTDILGTDLKLEEACMFDFDKHVDAIVIRESTETEERKRKYSTVNDVTEKRAEFDRRYLERPANRTVYKK